MEIDYKGLHWFKCDFHLHSPASRCFEDQTVTPELWVKAAKEAGLQCVAVTDHNTAAWIDNLKAEAEKEGLYLFPGVEVTCDTSKIHLLVIFDTNKGQRDVEDFLIECGISRDKFGLSEAHSSKSVFEMIDISTKYGALIIPAHIDEFNGLAYCASKDSVTDFLKRPEILAVQFVHQEFLDSEINICKQPNLLEKINAYYGKSQPSIGLDDIKRAIDGVKVAMNNEIRLLTFSDNPHSSTSSKHGLWGIGKRYSWIKMEAKPTLESLRQALIMRERAYNMFSYANCPYKVPELWIEKITIRSTTLTRKDEPFTISFNPQLTTIIGGRGSGKSSILRFLRGVFAKDKDIHGLDEIYKDHSEFFKRLDSDGRGVLKENSIIEVYFVRDNFEYKITYNQAVPSVKNVEKYDPVSGKYTLVPDEHFIDFFRFEQYSQKQIFAIAQKPNSLRSRIDDSILEMKDIHQEEESLKGEFKQCRATQRKLEQELNLQGRLRTEISDLESKISLLKQSGISELITKSQAYAKQKEIVNSINKPIEDVSNILDNVYASMSERLPLSMDGIGDSYRQEILELYQPLFDLLLTTKEDIGHRAEEVRGKYGEILGHLKNTKLYKESLENEEDVSSKRKDLESKGVTSISDFERYSTLLEQKKKELQELELRTKELDENKNKIQELKSRIFDLRKKKSDARVAFVRDVVNSDKISVEVNQFADQKHFESCLRKILQRSSNYDNGFETAKNEVYKSGDILDNLVSLKQKFIAINVGTYAGRDYDGRFSNLVEELTPEQMDELEIFYPEDEIEMKYRGRDGKLRSLSIASAGQKTTAILTFILSFGEQPLLLDQPEDDLDNKLVYDLIVEKLHQIKKRRQVIVVTHNANIPVNADAEYVVSMSSESKNLRVQAEGAVETENVKTEICEVMEGGVDAFRIRANRYRTLGDLKV